MLTESQQEEVEALKAIFGDEEVFEEAGGVMVLRVWKAMPDNPGLEEQLPTSEIPFAINFSVVPDYPSTSPPEISSISPSWLPQRLKNGLTAKLLAIYASYPGESVVYRWWEHLHEANLVAILEEQLQSRSTDNHVPGVLQLEPVELEELRNLHDARTLRVFDRTLHPCGVCLTELFGTSMVRGSGACLHPFCKDCLGEFCTMHIQEGTVLSLCCPEPKCGELLAPSVVTSLVSPPQFARYEQLMMQKALDRMKDIHYCPRKGCNTPVILDSADQGTCAVCLFSFCPHCEQASHGMTVCPLLEAPAAEEDDDKKGKGKGKDKAKKQDETSAVIKKREKASVAETTKLLQQTTRRCPNCLSVIEKNGGCDREPFFFFFFFPHELLRDLIHKHLIHEHLLHLILSFLSRHVLHRLPQTFPLVSLASDASHVSGQAAAPCCSGKLGRARRRAEAVPRAAKAAVQAVPRVQQAESARDH